MSIKPFQLHINPPQLGSYLDHNSFDALRPAGAEMETTEERIAHLEAEVANLRKEKDASTGKHATERIADPTTRKRKSSPHIASPPKRTRVDKSSLRINGKLKHLRSGGSSSFSGLL